MYEKIKNNWNHPEKIIIKLGQKSKLVSDRLYLQAYFYNVFGKKLDLENPRTFNEKLQWLKLYNRNPEYTIMVDKYAVKKYVADKIGDEYIIPTLGVWDNFDEINFDELPEQFVLKCTHDSGGLVVCKNKGQFDFSDARKKLTQCLKRNFYYRGREWPYKDVPRKIIAETYLEDPETKELRDYKLMCFNGKVKSTFVCTDRTRDLKVTFFDNNWKKMPFERHYPASKEYINKPINFDKMIELAEILARDIPFVRVDFYEVIGKIYFGELTFFPGAGFEEFSPEKWDNILGSWIELPDKKG